MKNFRLNKFFPYSRQNINSRDIVEVTRVLKSDFITQGPKILEFENNFAKFVKAKYAVACATGTAALHIACKSLGLSKNDTLLTTPITFVASANCAEFIGAKTLFSDINLENYCLCPTQLEKILKKKKIKIVVVVHLAGHAANLDKILKLKKKYKFKIIEDSCHALGGEFKKKKIGSCFFSEVSTFSFHPVKPITTGEGGMITTNSFAIYKKLLLFRTHGIHKNKENFINKNLGFDENKDQNIWYYEMQELGFNYRMTDIQAALGNSQLKKLNNFTKERSKIAKAYNKGFKTNKLIHVPRVSKDVKHAYHLYTILINFRKLKKSRNKVMKELRKFNIGSQVLYIPVHLQPYYKQKYNYKNREFPNAEKYYRDCLSIPIFPGIKKREIDFIINKINEIIK